MLELKGDVVDRDDEEVEEDVEEVAVDKKDVKSEAVDKSAQIKALFLKGFNSKEISKMLSLDSSIVDETLKALEKQDLQTASQGLYSELQKDLSKLVLTELAKTDRNPAVVLQAVRLQAELQEKKLSLIGSGSRASAETISKNYIYKRDNEVSELKSQGMSEEDIAKKFDISIFSVKQSLDRVALNLPDELKNVPPSVISETIGLDRDTRLKIIREAVEKQLSRTRVREIVVKYKNSTRG